MYITNKSKRINEDRIAANKLIEACNHFGIDPKMVARIINAVQVSLSHYQDDRKEKRA